MTTLAESVSNFVAHLRKIECVNDDGIVDDDKLDKILRKYPGQSDPDLGPAGVLTSERLTYLAERHRGVEHVWAVMTACRKGPSLTTDVSLFHGKRFLGDDLHPAHLQRLLAISRAHGHNPSQGDVYIPALAAFEGDPAAFVPATGGRAHIRSVLEQRNWACDGVVRRSADDRGDNAIPDGPVLADDLAMDAARKSGLLNGKTKRELPDVLQEMRTRHGVSSRNVVGEIPTVAKQVRPAAAPKTRKPKRG